VKFDGSFILMIHKGPVPFLYKEEIVLQSSITLKNKVIGSHDAHGVSFTVIIGKPL
jgi:hypothetical protein